MFLFLKKNKNYSLGIIENVILSSFCYFEFCFFILRAKQKVNLSSLSSSFNMKISKVSSCLNDVNKSNEEKKEKMEYNFLNLYKNSIYSQFLTPQQIPIKGDSSKVSFNTNQK
jgi:hypothetical protein